LETVTSSATGSTWRVRIRTRLIRWRCVGATSVASPSSRRPCSAIPPRPATALRAQPDTPYR